MNARPLPAPPLPRLLAVVTALLLPLTGRAQGPDDLPGEAPPPPPPPSPTATADLTQMPLDVTPPPLQPGAPQSPAQPAAPAASVPPAPTSAPTSTPGRYNQRRQNNNAAATPNAAAAPAAAASKPASPPVPTPAASGAAIRLNFQNASLADVLNYLSAAAGFIITQETPVTGTVNVVSQQPVTVDEAVDLLSSILSDKGYAVVRNGRILKIVALQDAPKNGNVPVYVTSNPADIPRKDNLVTQILPVRYAEVGKLVDNLRPLLSNNATISSNDSSNAIILTDTQTNIHRLAEIIHALDTSISGISQIRVFTLRYSDSKGLADVITQLFSPQQQGNNPNIPPQFAAFLNRIGGGGGRGGGGGPAPAPGAPESEARQAAARVVAVADETSNSVIVAAPDEVMSEVAAVIQQLDTSTSDITETQIFRLKFADATEMATNLSALYADTGNSTSNNNNNNNNNRGGQPQNRPPQNNQGANGGVSQRALLQSRVVVVADARTNSVLVSASHDTMSQVALTIGRLDADKSKKQHVFVYTLKHGDPDNVATILRGMYSTTSSTSSSSTLTQPSISALPTRTLNGASSDISNALSSGTATGSR